MRLIERDFYLNKLKDVMGTPDIKVSTGGSIIREHVAQFFIDIHNPIARTGAGG